MVREKSTAMRAMLGMLNLRQGIITINEKDISKFKSTRSS